MSDVQMFWALCAECVEFSSQRRIGAVLMESRHEEGQKGEQGLPFSYPNPPEIAAQ